MFSIIILVLLCRISWIRWMEWMDVAVVVVVDDDSSMMLLPVALCRVIYEQNELIHPLLNESTYYPLLMLHVANHYHRRHGIQ